MSNYCSHPLFRLLDELSFPPAAPHESTFRRAFSPNFDIYETAKEFILEGDLPGLSDKSKVHVEFTDAQTLLVKGRIERSYHSSSEDPGAIESKDKQAITESSKPTSPKSLKSTVEDKVDEADKATSVSNNKSEEKQAMKTKKRNGTKPRYWISERTVGEFRRRFSFPAGIDQEGVTASLEHGVLRITVPKRTHPVGKRIDIQ